MGPGSIIPPSPPKCTCSSDNNNIECNNKCCVVNKSLTVLHKQNKACASSLILCCYHCDFKTRVKNKLKKHILKTHIINNNTISHYECIICNKIELNKQNLRIHVKMMHSNYLPKSVCKLCNFKSNSTYLFRLHVKYAHVTLEDIFYCDLCGSHRKFKSYVNLKNHVNFVHIVPTKTFKCHICEKIFGANNLLEEHLLSHNKYITKKEPEFYFCHKCPQKYKKKNTLSKHLKTHNILHNNYPFNCYECSKRFKTKDILEDHMTKNHVILICKICREIVSSETELKSHTSLHHDKKLPFSCLICSTNFNTVIQLTQHIYK